jgi:hypothetical protein
MRSQQQQQRLSASDRSLPTLPKDIVRHVLSFLSPIAGLQRAAAVSRQWHALAQRRVDLALEHKLTLLHCSHAPAAREAPEALYRILRVCCGHYRRLILLLDVRAENSATLTLLHEELCAAVAGGPKVSRCETLWHTNYSGQQIHCTSGILTFHWLRRLDMADGSLFLRTLHDDKDNAAAATSSFDHDKAQSIFTQAQALQLVLALSSHEICHSNVVVVN